MSDRTESDLSWSLAWAGGSAMATGLRDGFASGAVNFLGVFATVFTLLWLMRHARALSHSRRTAE